MERYTISYQIIEVNEYGEEIDTVYSSGLAFATTDFSKIEIVMDKISDQANYIFETNVPLETVSEVYFGDSDE